MYLFRKDSHFIGFGKMFSHYSQDRDTKIWTSRNSRHSPAPTLAEGRLGEGGGEEVEAQELADVLLDAGFGVALV